MTNGIGMPRSLLVVPKSFPFCLQYHTYALEQKKGRLVPAAGLSLRSRSTRPQSADTKPIGRPTSTVCRNYVMCLAGFAHRHAVVSFLKFSV